MRRPWQIWLTFTLCLTAVVPAMLWVTFKSLELDRAEYAARLLAEQEEVVSRALWMIDARLGPLLAEEAARPDFVFRSLSGDRAVTNVDLANYLTTAPSHVLLHFELTDQGKAISPQVPLPSSKAPADANDQAYHQRLESLLASVSYDQLHSHLPVQSLPQLTVIGANDFSNAAQTPQVVANNRQDTALAAAQTEQDFAKGDDAQQQLVPQQRSGIGSQLENAYGSDYAPNSPAYNARRGKDLQQRNNTYNSVVARRIYDQRQQLEQEQAKSGPPVAAHKPITIREGISGPAWIDGKLLFARRVQRGQENVIQGCWLDWEALKRELLAEVAEILPQANLVPLTEGEEPRLGRLLATLPHMQLVVPEPNITPPAWSPIRMALAAAWSCLAFAALASGWLLMGVIALSERRASFVSAVTHELRTPLTTFRMYAEMLAANMIPSQEQRQNYLETLCVEADRLTHLVDNVLLYARLERNRGPRKNRVTLTVGSMLERFAARLQSRAEQSGLKLVVECDEAVSNTELCTDPGAVEQIVFNLVDNACKYAATTDDKRILLNVATRGSSLALSVRDFGPGLSPAAKRRLFQPFSKSSEEAAVSAPGVGLGLALCKRLAGDLGGTLHVAPISPGTMFVLNLSRR